MFEPGEIGYLVRDLTKYEHSKGCLAYRKSKQERRKVEIINEATYGFLVKTDCCGKVIEVNTRQIMRTPPMFQQTYR